MLTATYTLVALSVEQTSVKTSLQSLHKLLQSNFLYQKTLSPVQVEVTCDALKRLYESCHWRKLDKFLIPAIRRANGAAEKLLAELDALSQAAADAMSSALRLVETTALDTEARVAQFCEAVERFCTALLRRLEREEQELFALASSVISGEAWFAIANQMLAHDAYQVETRGGEPAARAARSYRPRAERASRQVPPLSLAH
jgi:hemerythrin-like domain-containing protein